MKKRINMKYLKKHRVPLIALLSVIVGLVCIALFVARSDRMERGKLEAAQKGQLQMEEDRKQLNDMAEYLDGIGQTVTENQENLAEASILQTEAEQTLTEVSKSLLQMEESIVCVENLINRQTEKQMEQNSEALLSITALSESQQELKSRIADLDASISSALSDIRAENKKDFISAFEKINALQELLQEAEESTREYYSSLESLVTLLQEEGKEEHRELAEALAGAKEEISVLLDNEFLDVHVRMEQDFTALMERLETLHAQVEDAENTIVSLLHSMEERGEDRQEEIREAFVSVALLLEQIKEDYIDAHEEIGSLILKLEEAGNNNHVEMLSALTIMENNMAENSMENLTLLTESLRDMEEKFSASIESMQSEVTQKISSLNNEITQNMSEYNSSISEMINRLDESITNQYQNLSNTVNNYDRGQQESIGNLVDALEKKLQQVFQFVSNGKRKVASALLTKGVSIEKDATFDEICNGILSVPQELVIGVQEIPGIVTYEKHYHVDKSGGTPHSERATAEGGCYTVPMYHTHTGDSRSGGGCYSVPIVHNHVDSCYTITKTIRRVTAHWYIGEGTGHACCDNAFGQNRARFAYVDEVYVNDVLVSSTSGEGDLGYCCGLCFDRKAAERGFTSTVTDINCGYSEGLNGYRTGCGKSNETVEAYMPGCGLADGQIVGAHIVYDRTAVSRPQAAAFSMNRAIEEVGAGDAKEERDAAVDKEANAATVEMNHRETDKSKDMEKAESGETLNIQSEGTGKIEDGTGNTEKESIENREMENGESIETEGVETTGKEQEEKVEEENTEEREIEGTEIEEFTETDAGAEENAGLGGMENREPIMAE